jgi:hypothetical protein
MSAGMADRLRTGRSIHRLDRKPLSNHRGRLALLARKCEVRTNELAQVARKFTGLAEGDLSRPTAALPMQVYSYCQIARFSRQEAVCGAWAE